MKNKLKAFWQGKGFYLALSVVVAGAAFASFFAINNMMDNLSTRQEPLIDGEEAIWDIEENTQVENKQEDVPITSSSASEPSSIASSPSPSSATSTVLDEPAEWQPAQTPSFTSPMVGEVVQAFSGDELVFNETMKDWRTHNGMDIAGSENIGVHAPTSATVSKVYEDAQWGGVIEMESGGVLIRLCGVKETRVAAGDTVQQGDTIAVLGAIPAEGEIETHLHVEFIENDKFVNPADYFA